MFLGFVGFFVHIRLYILVLKMLGTSQEKAHSDSEEVKQKYTKAKRNRWEMNSRSQKQNREQWELELKTAKQKLSDIQKSKYKLENENRRFKERIQTLTDELDQSKNKQKRKGVDERTLSDMKTRNQLLEEKLTAAVGVITQEKRQAKESYDKKVKLKNKLKTAEQDIKQFRDENLTLSAHVRILENRENNAQLTIDKEKERIIILTEQSNVQKHNSDVELSSLRAEIGAG